MRSLLAEVPDLPDHEARRLLLRAAAAKANWMLANPTVSPETTDRFLRMVERRRRGEPIQYIEGSTQFGRLELRSDERALVPRPETERLWEIGVDLIRDVDSPVVVDLCTGSGNLALAYKQEYPDACVYGTDISTAALSLAAENAALTGLDVELFQGDLFEALPADLRGVVDLLVSNPPYIASAEMSDLPREVRGFEPREALLAGDTGTEVLDRIAENAIEWLRPGGFVVCEIGETQGEHCLALFARYAPRTARDLAGRQRYVVGIAPEHQDVH